MGGALSDESIADRNSVGQQVLVVAREEKSVIRTLLIDNADSFTLNLFHLLAEVNGCAPTLVPNDWAEFDVGVLDDFDNVVISPGPGTPEKQADFGICAEVIAQSPIPVLGVCLGHQGIATVHGGVVAHAPEPRHGRDSSISHSGTELFDGIPSPFSAVRYHSLAVTELPAQLEATAWSEDGVIMGLRHRTRPQWGVQFHPESIASEEAAALMRNFAALTREWNERGVVKSAELGRDCDAASPSDVPAGTDSVCEMTQATNSFADPQDRYILDVDELPQTVSDARLFTELYGDEDVAVWLDGNLPGNESSRFSIMGAPTGPLSRIATASVAEGTMEIRTPNDGGSTLSIQSSGFFDWLEAEVSGTEVEAPDLPFEFRLGWVGYLGYELKTEVGSPNAHESDLPDAVMMFLDRAVVIDHLTERIYLLALRNEDADDSSDQWFARMREAIGAITEDSGTSQLDNETSGRAEGGDAPSAESPVGSLLARSGSRLTARHSQREYLGLIERVQQEITDGETYEVCLTNMLEGTVDPDETALSMYLRLRDENPTPFGAFIRTRDATILSTSPERFLRINADGRVESKPIKGTRPRGVTPEEDDAIRSELSGSVKDRAENLMIVDLVRHDLGRTAELGSVEVETLFGIETYATVHQMVSTVTSQLAGESSAVACVRASFPPGSMTGAPKLRTMSIIDELEAGPRSVYSGAIGYFSLGGVVDLSVAIRTLVLSGDSVRYGVGGAIVALSESDEEYAETVVKAAPLLRVLGGSEFPTGEDFHTVIPAVAGEHAEQPLSGSREDVIGNDAGVVL